MTDFYNQLMQEAILLHDRKAHDYSQDSNRYSNFERAAELVSWFKCPEDQVFACMIGIKIARLAELLNGKEPKNESIRDSFLDLINYSALWGSYIDSDKDAKEEFVKSVKTDEVKLEDILPTQDIYDVSTNAPVDVATLYSPKYTCNHCGLNFSTETQIMNHLHLKHQGAK